MTKGYLCLVLHAHLPYVRHPEHDYFLEEQWLYEALTETYIPLLEIIESLLEDHIDFRLTISLSPTLIEMFNDPLLRHRYDFYLRKKIELANKEVSRLESDNRFSPVVRMYGERFERVKNLYEVRYKKDITGAFKRIRESGRVEIITTAATHAFLPNFSVNRESVRAQVFIAVDYYKKIFGSPPEGLWIPECGYYPGLDDILKEAGIRYFFIDTHGLIYGRPAPRYGTYQPARCPSGVAAFARDAASSKEVWSSVEGYPGDFNYREFYRDIGFDLPADYIKPYIHPDGIRVDTGMKYYRITGKTEDKEPYVREKALETAKEHAGNFLSNREKQAAHFADLLGITPVITAPYDAELFGHWWFEGADWLNFLIRKTAGDSEIIKFITPSEYLNSGVLLQTVLPTQSSWGWKGYSETWLNDLNEWIYPSLHEAARKMSEIARENPDARGVALRALNQAARELLLAQSSDWPFMMAKKTVSSYARKRVKEHLQWFNQLYSGIKSGAVDVERLGHLEKINNIFRDIDYRVYSLDYELSNLSKG
ncbi:MAG: DUF1957 domain-containing protein [Nitrospirae bacterium]|nr:DUF1957 domain-containing protein [Nitrospirota bacterium]